MTDKPVFQFSWGNYQAMKTIEGNVEAIGNDNPWRKVSDVIELCRANNIRTYHSTADFAADIERSEMFLQQKPYDDFISGMEAAVATYWQTYADIRAIDTTILSDDELWSLYERVDMCWRRIMPFFYATQPEGIEGLLSAIRVHVSEEELSALLWPQELDVANKETIAWYAIAKQPYDEKRLMDHAYNYPWTVAAHFTYEDVLATLKARYEYDIAHVSAPTIAAEKEKALSRQLTILAAHPDVEVFARRAQRFALSRMEIKASFAGSDFYLIPLIHEIARRTGESYLDISLYYLFADVRALLFERRLVSSEQKAARKKCFIAAVEGGIIKYLEGDEAESYAKDKLGSLCDEGASVQRDILAGITATKGVARGTVKILHANDVARARELRVSFQKGDILVTEMTQPNILDIAARAGAIVTDEGSLLSHAAIISREFGIPCVVYTRIATRAFKDGDMVEVDATAGIVRKI